MNYIGAYVLEVPTTSKDAYRDLAEKMAVAFKKHGAWNVVENWVNDVT